MKEPAANPVIVLHPEGVEVPAGITSLDRFREWVRSDGFPQKGRIDWVAGRLEVDMTPEDVNTHASPKSAIAGELVLLGQKPQRGLVCIDSTRISSPDADLSAEPDILVLLVETVEGGRARLVPKAGGKEERYVEIEGSPDLVVECVSDASTRKDKQRLRELYHRAGVREYWIVDARRDPVEFQVLEHLQEGFVPAETVGHGFQRSAVLERRIRFRRTRKAAGIAFFQLDVET
jgi:Uma2 family endonuclease